MIRQLFAWLKKKALPRKGRPTQATKPEGSAYTEEEARKVKERLQGLGYID